MTLYKRNILYGVAGKLTPVLLYTERTLYPCSYIRGVCIRQVHLCQVSYWDCLSTNILEWRPLLEVMHHIVVEWRRQLECSPYTDLTQTVEAKNLHPQTSTSMIAISLMWKKSSSIRQRLINKGLLAWILPLTQRHGSYSVWSASKRPKLMIAFPWLEVIFSAKEVYVIFQVLLQALLQSKA